MKITCLHGYFIVREDLSGEVAKFNSFYSQDLVAKDDYYTFSALAPAPIYSVAPLPYLGVPTIKTYCANPWDVMRQNALVYNFASRLVIPISAVNTQVPYARTYYGYSSNGLIQPGSTNPGWQKITGYQAIWEYSDQTFAYTELFYD